MYHLHRCHRVGRTLTDLIVAMGLIMMIGTLALRTSTLASSRSGQVKCGSNLRQIGQSIMMYANDNKGMYPRTLYTPGAPLTSYTGEVCSDPFNGPGAVGTPPQANDVTAAMFQLIRAQDLSSEVFICPSSNDEKDTFGGGTNTAQSRSNFKTMRGTLSYSMANPYPDAAAIAKGYKWNNTLNADFAIMADMNPGGATLTALTAKASSREMAKGNTYNHQGQGQYVMYGDGHVEWQQNPFVGVKRDNIYTVSSGDVEGGTSSTIEGLPTWGGDSVLLPIAVVDPRVEDMRSISTSNLNININLIIGGGVLLAAIATIVIVLLLKKKRDPARLARP